MDTFRALGLPQAYFERFDEKQISRHADEFAVAKKDAAANGAADNVSVASIEAGSMLFMVPQNAQTQAAVEQRIAARIDSLPTDNTPFCFESFVSDKAIVAGGKSKLGVYYLSVSAWSHPKAAPSHQHAMSLGEEVLAEVPPAIDIKELATTEFSSRKISPAATERYTAIVREAASKLEPVASVFTEQQGTTLMCAFRVSSATTSHLTQFSQLLQKFAPVHKSIENFRNGVRVYCVNLGNASRESVDELVKEFNVLNVAPQSSILTPLFLSGCLTADTYAYAACFSRYAFYFLNRRTAEEVAKNPDAPKLEASHERIHSCLSSHLLLLHELFSDFVKNATQPHIGARPLNAALPKRIQAEASSELDREILVTFLVFNAHVLKTNFFLSDKAAYSFRLDAKFVTDCGWPNLPFGVLFICGSEFQGFHVRFRDIARGGIRAIRSANQQQYLRNLASQFKENYGLAYTQQLKNKDLAESGSKGTILLNVGLMDPFGPFQKYVSAMLDIIGDHPRAGVVDNYGKPEILFLGPDEYTADFMAYACRYAQKRHYQYWRAFTTGKPPVLGGVPHDSYGMTTRGVRAIARGCLKKLDMQEEKITKLQTGGPDGDLGSNEILLSKERTIGVVDGSGVVGDPDGLNRDELVRLAKARQMIEHFDVSKLGKRGFRVLLADKNVRLPSGELVEDGTTFRNEFHLNPLADADIFVPCGGRPEAVNIQNVKRMLKADGTPRFRVIVEGANLFITQEARLVLEKAGVILYKDATANKGGVTSSSCEVLAALAMPEPMFEQNMVVKDAAKPPHFYEQYAQYIQGRIERDALLEFECIWREALQTKIERCVLTNMVSEKITKTKEMVQQSAYWNNVAVRRAVLADALPKPLLDLMGLDQVMARVPEAYLRGVFGAYLGGQFIYRCGLKSTDASFDEFMKPYMSLGGRS